MFPLERAPPPRDEGCRHNGFGDPALHASNGSPPNPSPPSKSSSPSSVSTSFPTLVTMGGIAPADACPPPATLTEWRFYTSQEGIDGTFMINIRSGERLWEPPASDWDYGSWDIKPLPNPEGTWYRVPSSRRWVQLDEITSWIHRPTGYQWYLVEDTAQPIVCARPPLPHQIEFILAKLTLRRMTHNKRGSVAKPVESGRYLSPNPPHPVSYVGALLSPRGGDCKPSSQVLQSTTANDSAAITLHQTARRRKRPRRRPGRRNVPRAPNPADEAIPSHPQPMMGGTSTPTTILTATSARATTLRLLKSSPMSFAMTSSSSPSLQPFTSHEKGTIAMGERDAHQRKGTCRRIRPRRVGRRHGPRAPNPPDHLLCGGRHRPRASNQSTGWASA
jgi:hypothetical protein